MIWCFYYLILTCCQKTAFWSKINLSFSMLNNTSYNRPTFCMCELYSFLETGWVHYSLIFTLRSLTHPQTFPLCQGLGQASFSHYRTIAGQNAPWEERWVEIAFYFCTNGLETIWTGFRPHTHCTAPGWTLVSELNSDLHVKVHMENKPLEQLNLVLQTFWG